VTVLLLFHTELCNYSKSWDIRHLRWGRAAGCRDFPEYFFLHFPFRALWFSCYNINQRKHALHYNYNNVPIGQLLHISGLTPWRWAREGRNI